MPRAGLVELGFWGAIQRVTPIYVQGALTTLQVTAVAVVLGLVVGLIVALMKLSRVEILRRVGSFYTWIIRGTPLLVQIYIIYFGLVQYGVVLDPFPAAVIALTVNSGAYLAEIIRAGIESIPKGQMEAARSLGMSYGQAMRRVILPQAYRRMIPPMVNEFVTLLKDSSLVSIISMEELMLYSRQLANATARGMWFFGYAAFYYLVMTTLFTTLGSWLERKLKDYE
ncbi:amino acid ABC transporter membrane protein, PAAT family [Thermaerobacter marianensis DSM 12885]|uniref:Amino acid ABC transporter membrane protein, PAAT family n=1 Tax=Thermaerobacter marianensis (strain ATCC 700841 / DSM 12885 / JCM 10246 / 7p75a) TaxID=644966 RepID=E6SGU5_THEM7|nr:amino acid ABC transporter permease [Thermaerobacter marianensis]ADU51679.1 amino acid ABC transporter membrane protein, PAAT family [Thermaerobacter marianensis DSM 12885]